MNSLICINTAKRSSAIKALIWPYVEFCRSNEAFDFVVSLDGSDRSTIKFCEKFGIPVLYSEKCEGVGLSKNRILTEYPSYKYYFFIEDDTALLNSKIFSMHIEVAEELSLHHMSLFERSRLIDVFEKKQSRMGTVLHARYGSAQFNFFTRKGIDVVGGFHPEFAKYCRYGHTEHSYRFVNNGLSDAAFCVIERCLEGYLKFSDPPSVTKRASVSTKNRLFPAEEKLIGQRIKNFPIKTICAYYAPDSLSLEGYKSTYRKRLYEMRYWSIVYLLKFARNVKRWLR